MSTQIIPLAFPGALLVGIALAAVFLLIARRLRSMETAILAAGVITAALLYFSFAVMGGSNSAELRRETMGLAIFTTLAGVGVFRWRPLVGIAWLLHAGWDILLHWPPQKWVPELYPIFCVSFDLVIAAYFLFLWAMPANAREREGT